MNLKELGIECIKIIEKSEKSFNKNNKSVFAEQFKDLFNENRKRSNKNIFNKYQKYFYEKTFVEEDKIYEKKDIEDIGKQGEEEIYKELEGERFADYNRNLCNLYVPIGAYYTEIDVVAIHNSYIFVIESKNYSGWIFGDENGKKWTQTLKNGEKNQFYNPVLQNNTHISALSEFLGVPNDKFMSLIVFSERCELKKIPENTQNRMIMKRHDLIENIKKNCYIQNFQDHQINEFYQNLIPLTKAPEVLKQEHVSHVQNAYKM